MLQYGSSCQNPVIPPPALYSKKQDLEQFFSVRMIDWASKRWTDSTVKAQFELYMHLKAVKSLMLMIKNYFEDPETERVASFQSRPLSILYLQTF